MLNSLKAGRVAPLSSRDLTSDAPEHRLSVCAPNGHSVRCHNFGGIHFVVVQRSVTPLSAQARRPVFRANSARHRLGPSGSLLIFAHRRIDLFAPGVETTFEIE